MGEIDGSAWSNAPQGDDSGWLSVDGTRVVLPSTTSAGDQPWPVSQRRIFYAAKIPRSVDEKLRNNIKLAESRLEETVRKRDAVRTAMQAKRASKVDLLEKLKPVRDKERASREAIQGRRSDLEPFVVTLNKFKSAAPSRNSKGMELCTSEEELNRKIAEMKHRIEHESIPLKEEKQLMRDIKQLESTRGQVRANIELQAELHESLGSKEEIQDQYDLMCHDLDALRQEHKQARTEYDIIDKEIQKINDSLEELRQQFEKANVAQQEAFMVVKELRKQENAKNNAFFQNKRDSQAAKELILQKKVDDLEAFCSTQVEDFFVLWNSNSKFRSDYMESNERSTIRRLETLDGRLLGLDEKPLQLKDDTPAALFLKSTESKSAPSLQSNVHAPKARQVASQVETRDVEGEVARAKQYIMPYDVGDSKGSSQNGSLDDTSTKDDTAEAKEKRRQEEMVKAREAAERKKKRADKAEAKALARAKKAAEKEREKAARKKAVSAEDALPLVEQLVMEAENTVEQSPREVSKKPTNDVHEPEKPLPIQRGRLPLKRKGLRPILAKSSSKKGIWPPPIWSIVLALFTALVILFFTAVYTR